MRWIRSDVLSGKLMAGTFLNLGSNITAEIAGKAGFDWLLIDMEHGSGGHISLVQQLQAIAGTPAAPVVRIEWNTPPRFKRVLDLGPSGVMVPYVNDAEEARQAVRSMRYPPAGIRGVASINRAGGFGEEFSAYFSKANTELVTVVQVETAHAIRNASEIAAVDGVDVLFIGPMDLSVSLGHPTQLEHPDFRSAVEQVIAACNRHGKAAGILLKPENLDQAVDDGFTFIALGSDGGLLASGMRDIAAAFEKYR
jgi:4-hydroxy-2-oxoheptanedioate aldolase